MFDDITEFTRFYQTGTGQRVAGLIRQQLGSFWPSGSSSSVAFFRVCSAVYRQRLGSAWDDAGAARGGGMAKTIIGSKLFG